MRTSARSSTLAVTSKPSILTPLVLDAAAVRQAGYFFAARLAAQYFRIRSLTAFR
jgi:hypothetical protein